MITGQTITFDKKAVCWRSDPYANTAAKTCPNDSDEAMICSFECTFCVSCVKDILKNVCPNCGGGFEKRPTRPVRCFTSNCLERYPATRLQKHQPVNPEVLKKMQQEFFLVDPRKR